MTNPNDPVNPTPIAGGDSSVVSAKQARIPDVSSGLTKRELFAAIAMGGLLGDYVKNGQYGSNVDYPMVEGIAVRCADYLIKELNRHTS
jgi:hypothetical protein